MSFVTTLTPTNKEIIDEYVRSHGPPSLLPIQTTRSSNYSPVDLVFFKECGREGGREDGREGGRVHSNLNGTDTAVLKIHAPPTRPSPLLGAQLQYVDKVFYVLRSCLHAFIIS